MTNMDIVKLKELCSSISVLYVEGNKYTLESNLAFFNIFFNSTRFILNENYKESTITNELLILEQMHIDIIFYDLSTMKLPDIQILNNIKKNKDIIVIGLMSNNINKNTKFISNSLKEIVDIQIPKTFILEEFNYAMQSIVDRIQYNKPAMESEVSVFISLDKELLSRNYSYIALFDIQNFSIINKLYGKSFGDKVIQKIKAIFEKQESSLHKFYKVESDKFVFLLKEKNEEDIKSFSNNLLYLFQGEPLIIEGQEIDISFNVGFSLLSNNVNDLINAEYALQLAKEDIFKNYHFYDPNNQQIKNEKETVAWFSITKKLISEKEIYPYFQPIKDIKTGKIAKYEVLARGLLNNEIIPPMFFLSAAEKLGLASEVTKIIIEKSFFFFSGTNTEFSINVCAQDLLSGYLPDFLTLNMSKFNIQPEQVTFEVLENIAISDKGKDIIEQINVLKLMGFNIAIDDFGADNSNFGRLIDIDCDILKIDRLFIKNIHTNKKHKIIVKTIVELAKSLEIKTVAEFVESEEIYNTIKECGVDYAQGYFIGKPDKNLIGEKQ